MVQRRLSVTTEEVRHAIIVGMYVMSECNKSQAARRMGMNVRTVRNIIQELSIENILSRKFNGNSPIQFPDDDALETCQLGDWYGVEREKDGEIQ